MAAYGLVRAQTPIDSVVIADFTHGVISFYLVIQVKKYIIRIYFIFVHFHVFFELIQYLLPLIYSIFYKCHWICFLLLTSQMLNLCTMFGIVLIKRAFSILAFKYSAAFLVMRVLLIPLMSNTGIVCVDEILPPIFLHPMSMYL